MGFLARLASGILKVTAIVSGFGPLLPGLTGTTGAVVQRIEGELTQVASVIQQVEVFGQALSIKGPQKLVAATPAVAQILLQSSMMAGKKIADPDLFKAGSQKIADGMADILNSLHENGVQTIEKV